MKLEPGVRRQIYTTLVAVGAVLVFYGIATGEEVAVWLNVVAVALMTGGSVLARQNTPTDDDAE